MEPVYQAVWADNNHFDEVLFSPTMVNDHLPDNVMEALEKVYIMCWLFVYINVTEEKNLELFW